MLIYRKFDKVITGTAWGKPFNLPRIEESEKFLEELKKNEDNLSPDEIKDKLSEFLNVSRGVTVASKVKYLVYNPSTDMYYLQLDGKISKYPLPQYIAESIEEQVEAGGDFIPLIKAWARLLNNPRINSDMVDFFDTYINTTYTDVEEAEKFKEAGYSEDEAMNLATYSDLAITQEGLLATYKVVDIVDWKFKMEYNDETFTWEKVRVPRYEQAPPVVDETTGEILEDGKLKYPEYKEDILFTPSIYKYGDKFYSGDKLGYVYQVGKIHSLPKNALRNLRNTFGGGGLYTGGLNYIKNYKQDDNIILLSFVDPANILSFQDEGNAIRTDAMFVYDALFEGTKLKGKYHSSEYAKLSEEALEQLITDAINANHIDDVSEFRSYQESISERRQAGEELDAPLYKYDEE